MINDNVEIISLNHSSESLIPKIDYHHPPLDIFLKFVNSNFNTTYEYPIIYNFNKCNFNEISNFLSNIDFESNLNNKIFSMDEIVTKFYEIIHHTFSLFVPKTKIFNNYSPVWADANLRNLIVEKKLAHKKFKLCPSPGNYLEFSRLRKECKILTSKNYSENLRHIENSIQTNIKPFWKYINTLKKNVSNIPESVKFKNSSSSNIQENAQLFADFFSSVFDSDLSKSFVHNQPSGDFSNNLLNLSSWYINKSEIYEYLNSLDTNSATGPDGVPSSFLKACGSILVNPLYLMFNKSLTIGYFPNIWKMSFVTPIHKSGDKHDVMNYRPISKLSIIPKIFEAIITKKLSSIISPYICKNQHGFRPKMSISTNLLLYQSKILNSFKNHIQVDSIYTDFQKAFDKVNHKLLLKKLFNIGFNGNFLDWIESYLTCRTQAVKLSLFTSNYFSVCSGVPQGSHLGPLLFILFINDLPTVLDSSVNILLFADDAKLFSPVESLSDAVNLQSNLDKLVSWSKQNCLPLNINKCSIITFTRLHKPILFNYSIDHTTLTRVNHIRDLGILLEANMSYSSHINMITNKAFKMLGFIYRNTKNFKNIISMKMLYFSLVRSHLEFGSMVWSPNYALYINQLENVQYKFLKLTCNKLNLTIDRDSYHFQLTYLGVSLCEIRRSVADLMFLYYLLNGNIDSSELLSMVGFNFKNHGTRSHNIFVVPSYTTNYSSASFFPRVLTLANSVACKIDFFFMSRQVFKHNVYLALHPV
uniref:Putative RNA-directed DNA polymerase n=1 Tax=Schizaphis graminum TaxID=13262 RepID=A0A2S2NJ55_SCHGA